MSTENQELEHRGEWLRKQIEIHGFTYKLISDLILIDKATIFRYTKKPDLGLKQMKLIADAIGLDLREHFPAATSLYLNKEVNYKDLYEREVETTNMLRESVTKYKVLLGLNRDNPEEK